jgi:hypothetical protein
MSRVDDLRECLQKLDRDGYLGALSDCVLGAFPEHAMLVQGACTGPADGGFSQSRAGAAIALFDATCDPTWLWILAKGRLRADEGRYGCCVAMTLTNQDKIGVGYDDDHPSEAMVRAIIAALIWREMRA